MESVARFLRQELTTAREKLSLEKEKSETLDLRLQESVSDHDAIEKMMLRLKNLLRPDPFEPSVSPQQQQQQLLYMSAGASNTAMHLDAKAFTLVVEQVEKQLKTGILLGEGVRRLVDFFNTDPGVPGVGQHVSSVAAMSQVDKVIRDLVREYTRLKTESERSITQLAVSETELQNKLLDLESLSSSQLKEMKSELVRLQSQNEALHRDLSFCQDAQQRLKRSDADSATLLSQLAECRNEVTRLTDLLFTAENRVQRLEKERSESFAKIEALQSSVESLEEMHRSWKTEQSSLIHAVTSRSPGGASVSSRLRLLGGITAAGNSGNVVDSDRADSASLLSRFAQPEKVSQTVKGRIEELQENLRREELARQELEFTHKRFVNDHEGLLLQHELAKEDLSRARKELLETKQMVDNATALLKRKTDESISLAEQLHESQEQLTVSEDRRNELRRQLQELKAKHDLNEESLESTRAELRELSQEKQRLAAENVSLNASVQKFTARDKAVESLETELSTARAQRQELLQVRTDLESRVEELEQKNSDLQTRLRLHDARQKESSALAAGMVLVAAQDLEGLRSQAREVAHTQEQNLVLQEQRSRLQADVDYLQGEVRSLSSRLSASLSNSRRVSELTNDLAEKDIALEAASKRYCDLQADVQRLLGERDSYIEQVQQLQGQMALAQERVLEGERRQEELDLRRQLEDLRAEQEAERGLWEQAKSDIKTQKSQEESKRRACEEQLSNALARLGTANDSIRKLQRANEEISAKLKQTEEAVAPLQAQTEIIGVLRAREVDLLAQVRDLQSAKDRLEEESHTLGIALSAADERVNVLSAGQDEMRRRLSAELAESQKAVKDLQDERVRLLEERSAALADSQHLLSQMAVFQQSVADYEAQISMLRARLSGDRVREERERDERWKAMEREAETHRSEIAALHSQLSALREELTSTRRQRHELETSVAGLTTENTLLTSDAQRMQSKIAEMTAGLERLGYTVDDLAPNAAGDTSSAPASRDATRALLLEAERDEYRKKVEETRRQNIQLHQETTALSMQLESAKAQMARDADAASAKTREVQKLLAEREDDLSAARRKSETLAAELQEVREQLQISESRFLNVMQELVTLKDEHERMNAMSRVVQTARDDAASEGARLHRELARLMAAESAWGLERQSNTAEISRLTGALEAAQAGRSDSDHRLSDAMVMIEAIQEDKATLVEAMARLETESSQVMATVELVLTRELTWARELEDRTTSLERATEASRRFETELAEVANKYDELQQSHANLSSDLNAQDAEHRQLIAERDRLLARERTLVAEVQQLERNVADLSQRYKEDNAAVRVRAQEREADLVKTLETAEKELADLRKEHRQLSTQSATQGRHQVATIENMQMELETSRKELDVLRREVEDRRIAITQLLHQRETEVGSLRKQVLDTTTERDMLRMRLERIEEARRIEDTEHVQLLDSHRRLEQELHAVSAAAAHQQKLLQEGVVSPSSRSQDQLRKDTSLAQQFAAIDNDRRLQESREEAHQLKLRITLVESQNSSLEAESTRLRQKADELRRENDDLHATRMSLTADLRKAEQERDHALAAAAAAADRESHLTSLVEELSELRGDVGRAQTTTVQAEIQYMHETLRRAQQDLELALESYRDQTAKISEHEHNIQNLRLELEACVASKVELELQVRNLRTDRDRLSEQLTQSLKESVSAFEEGSRAALQLRRENDKLRAVLKKSTAASSPGKSPGKLNDSSEVVMDEVRDLLDETMKRLDDEEAARSNLTREIERRDEVIRQLRASMAAAASADGAGKSSSEEDSHLDARSVMSEGMEMDSANPSRRSSAQHPPSRPEAPYRSASSQGLEQDDDFKRMSDRLRELDVFLRSPSQRNVIATAEPQPQPPQSPY